MAGLLAQSVAGLVVVASLSACARGSAAGSYAPPTPSLGPPTSPQNVITAATIAATGDDPIEKVIADRVPGCRLRTMADGSLGLEIRGTTSWTTDNPPLYVIDGVAASLDGGLIGINKWDIARIQVLKDGPSTALYGSRGASGVVLIETKKP